jgi:hypothetical protein
MKVLPIKAEETAPWLLEKHYVEECAQLALLLEHTEITL